MTAERIAEQIIAIREATKTASASPEAARAFLQRAGIIGISDKTGGKPSAAAVGYSRRRTK